MTEYALGVFVICVTVGIASKICYNEDGVLRFALSVVALYVILTPLSGLCTEGGLEISLPEAEYGDVLGEAEYGDVLGEGEYSAVAKEALEAGVSIAVSEKFSVSEDSFRVVAVNFDFSKMKAERIKIFLSLGAAYVNKEAVEDYVNKMNVGVCDVEFEI